MNLTFDELKQLVSLAREHNLVELKAGEFYIRLSPHFELPKSATATPTEREEYDKLMFMSST